MYMLLSQYILERMLTQEIPHYFSGQCERLTQSLYQRQNSHTSIIIT